MAMALALYIQLAPIRAPINPTPSNCFGFVRTHRISQTRLNPSPGSTRAEALEIYVNAIPSPTATTSTNRRQFKKIRISDLTTQFERIIKSNT